MILEEFTDYTYYLAWVGEGVCVDNDDDIHNHNDNYHSGELAAYGKDGVSECRNTENQILNKNCEFSPGWG